MSGHSKWANIKHRKGAADAKRGKIFTKLIKEIIVAARLGGGDINGNPRLRAAVIAGKAVNMPKDNIERAIKKGTGDLEGVSYEEITYEGYGPGGVAVMVECMTDNRVRTVADVRFFFNKSGGNLGETNCVSWMFDRKGLMVVDQTTISEEALMDAAIEAGAEDVSLEDDTFQIHTDPEQFNTVSEALQEKGIVFIEASITMIPKNTVEVGDEKTATQLMKLLDNLEDNDDVQKVHANFDIPDAIMEAIS